VTTFTEEQQTRIVASCKRFYEAATSTTTDRAKAEKAIEVIVAPVLPQYEVHWCTTLEEAKELRGPLRNHLSENQLENLSAILSAKLSTPQLVSLSATLSASLNETQGDALRNELALIVGPSFLSTIWDTYWVAHYVIPVELGLVEYTETQQAQLDAYRAFMESAFAVWVFLGHVIVLEKPTRVTRIEGHLLDLVWESKGSTTPVDVSDPGSVNLHTRTPTEIAEQIWGLPQHAWKAIDTELTESIAAELEREQRMTNLWFETARKQLGDTEYYRGLVQQIGRMLGEDAYLSDDGSRQQDILCAKVPELVKALLP
jgi:hypothetical protein